MVHKVPMEIEKDEFWFEICDRLFDLMPSFLHFSERVRQNPVARLIGWLPFLANTDQPQRDSITNMTIYLLSGYGSSRDIFFLSESRNDVLFDCLATLLNFTNGDEKILHRGLSLICIVLLNEYEKNRDEDRSKGKYNPLNAGVWNFDELMRELEAGVKAVPCRKMDRILSLEAAAGCYWNP